MAESEKGVRLQDLKLNSCRYPLGDAYDRVEFFCGAPTKPGCSWCEEHRRRVFVRLAPPVGKTRSAA
jgi:hypothetical protein